jgi:hypothetical protein
MSKNKPSRTRTATATTTTTTATTSEEPKLLRTYTIDSLAASANPPDPRLSDRIFRNVKEQTLLDRGKDVETGDILSSIPQLLGSTKEIYAALSEAQQRLVVGYSPRLDDLLISEVLRLHALKRRFDAESTAGDTSRARSRATFRTVRRRGILLRDQAATAMRAVVGDTDTADAVELRSARGTAETDDDLAGGLDSIADLIDGYLKNGDEATQAHMEDLKLTPAYVSQLRSMATEVRTASRAADVASPASRVTETTLNLQDGRVMHIVGLIYRPFREARKQDASILLPKLGALRYLFESRYRKSTSEPTNQPPAPPRPSSPDTGGSTPPRAPTTP